MFAIIRTQGFQYRVSEGDTVSVPHMEGAVGDKVTISEVLLLSDGKKVTVGTPVVKGATVTATIETQHKGEKVDVRRFKSKVRYRRARGFRPLVTDLVIGKIVEK